jgi:hypothetical protein
MKNSNPTKQFIFSLFILCLSFSYCKKGDNDQSSGGQGDNFSEYFTCKINGEEFDPRGDFICINETFYYYPAGTGGLEEAYMLISGTDCPTDLTISLRIFNPIVPSTGSFDFEEHQFADSVSPGILHFVSNGSINRFEDLASGSITINTFTPRDSVTMEFGKIEGTFEFMVTNESQDSTVQVTDGAFRFRVPNFW